MCVTDNQSVMSHNNSENRDPLVKAQLQLQRQHLSEWQLLIALEIENQFALKEKFIQELNQHPAGINYKVQATLTTQHVVELNMLKEINRQKRAFVKERQAREKAQLNDAIAESINKATTKSSF